jgi:SAM-dependent methyltransferase
MKIEERYLSDAYFISNPNWDREDALWKATIVKDIIQKNSINPASIIEVGCGSGDILVHMSSFYKNTKMVGYDISPKLKDFWEEHEDNPQVSFFLEDFEKSNKAKFDILLMLDVFEHVRDPFSFLENVGSHAEYFVFHIPLDLSASSVLRGQPLMYNRHKVGHLNFYTKDLALETLRDSKYSIIDWKYTGASFNMPHRKLKTRLFSIFRKVLFSINKDFGVRLLGGETLLVLAKYKP